MDVVVACCAGLDVHKEAITVAVRNGAGKLVMESILETKASTLLEFLDQHHGLGQLLLKHLAEAARPRGITTFTAETQADNRGMLGVFHESGFPVTSSIEDEVVSVSFPIEPTEKSRARYAGRRTNKQAWGGDKGNHS